MAEPTATPLTPSPSSLPIQTVPPTDPSRSSTATPPILEEDEEEMFPNPLNPLHSLLRSGTEAAFLSHQLIRVISPADKLSALSTQEIEKILHIFIACGMLSPTTADEKNLTPELKVWADGLLRKFMRCLGMVEEEPLGKADLRMLQVVIFLATEAAAGMEASAGKSSDEVEDWLYKTIRDGAAKEPGSVGPIVEDEEISTVLLERMAWGLSFILGMVVYCKEGGKRLEIEYIRK